MVSIITKECGLVGVNGIDFLLTDECDVLFLEVNPRYSSSMELYRKVYGLDIFRLHVEAFEGRLPERPSAPRGKSKLFRTVLGVRQLFTPHGIWWRRTQEPGLAKEFVIFPILTMRFRPGRLYVRYLPRLSPEVGVLMPLKRSKTGCFEMSLLWYSVSLILTFSRALMRGVKIPGLAQRFQG